MSTSPRLSRRTVLRGMGVTLALPLLDAMVPRAARAAAAAPGEAPLRLGFVYVPNGAHMPDWTPTEAGTRFELPPIFEPVAAHRERMNILSGLTADGARPHGDGPGDHARSLAAFLTGAHPKKTHGADIHNGVSIDQFLADKLGDRTRLASLELGLERGAQAGNCDSGYSCAYSSNISWRSPTSPVAKEADPRAVFDRLFAGPDVSEAGRSRTKRQQYQKSVLDFVLEDAEALSRRLGAADQQKLDEYLYSVRDVEKRIVGADKLPPAELPFDFERPAGVPREFTTHAELMLDLIALAFQTDSTRIVTFMFANEGSGRNYPEIEVREGHHDLSHHGRNQDKQAKISKINRHHMSLFGRLLDRLAAAPEGQGTVLDNSLLVYGSGIGDGDAHNHDNLPVALFGRGGGRVEGGRHLEYEHNTPITNLFLTMAGYAGVSADKFGDSTGKLEL